MRLPFFTAAQAVEPEKPHYIRGKMDEFFYKVHPGATNFRPEGGNYFKIMEHLRVLIEATGSAGADYNDLISGYKFAYKSHIDDLIKQGFLREKIVDGHKILVSRTPLLQQLEQFFSPKDNLEFR